MIKCKEKICVTCGDKYLPTGHCAKFCSPCALLAHRRRQKEGRIKHQLKLGKKVGVGSGGITGSGEDNFMYSHGRCTFRRWAKERKLSIGLCEHCGKDIKEATHYDWVGHHKDHNPMNNVIENLVILCKKCHQVEHECWKAFEGVTTIRKE